jgi:hypothetical protein
MNPDEISAISNAVTAVVAVSAGWFAIREYRRSGRWKAAELAAGHLQRLGTDERLVFACHALDWGVGPIRVPEEYRTMAGKEMIEHSPDLVRASLKPDLDPNVLEHRVGLVYRHCFDHLFGYLDSAQELLDLGLVEPAHLSGIRYWLAHLANWRYAGQDGKEVFIPFLIGFGYGRALRLFESLKVDYTIPPGLEAKAKDTIAQQRA